MGILNVTPDSFSDGGLFNAKSKAVDRAWQIAREGADILDLGGESTRPDSGGIGPQEELDRVAPVLAELAGSYPLPISIDTSKIEVARAAVELGAAIINDVTALQHSPEIGELAATSGAAMVLMHMRGTPKTMQKLPTSPNIIEEIEQWIAETIARVEKLGVSSNQLILDPGIGFGKSVKQNLEILRELSRLARAGRPLLVGTSRKSFIGAILGKPEKDRIWGTSATVAAAILWGAHIVRVHDVAAMREVAVMTDALAEETDNES